MKNGLVMLGAALAVLGVIALAIPVFTTQESTDLVKVGDLKVTAKEEKSHVIPPYLGWGGLVIGGVLIVAGMASARRG